MTPHPPSQLMTHHIMQLLLKPCNPLQLIMTIAGQAQTQHQPDPLTTTPTPTPTGMKSQTGTLAKEVKAPHQSHPHTHVAAQALAHPHAPKAAKGTGIVRGTTA